jgi:DsbC/DsbD-like thiol-disulfide interchange protein
MRTVDRPPASIRPVKWSVLGGGVAHEVVVGRSVPITLVATIAPGWHIYSPSQKPGGPIPLTIRLVDTTSALIRGLVEAPRPERIFDKNFGIDTELYSGNPHFTVRVGVPAQAPRGTRKIQIGARYQVCSETLCLPPRTDKLEVTLDVVRRS